MAQNEKPSAIRLRVFASAMPSTKLKGEETQKAARMRRRSGSLLHASSLSGNMVKQFGCFDVSIFLGEISRSLTLWVSPETNWVIWTWDFSGDNAIDILSPLKQLRSGDHCSPDSPWSTVLFLDAPKQIPIKTDSCWKYHTKMAIVYCIITVTPLSHFTGWALVCPLNQNCANTHTHLFKWKYEEMSSIHNEINSVTNYRKMRIIHNQFHIALFWLCPTRGYAHWNDTGCHARRAKSPCWNIRLGEVIQTLAKHSQTKERQTGLGVCTDSFLARPQTRNVSDCCSN